MMALMPWVASHASPDRAPWMASVFPVGDGWICATDGHSIAFARGSCAPVEGVSPLVADYLAPATKALAETTVIAILTWCGARETRPCGSCAIVCSHCGRSGPHPCDDCDGSGEITLRRSGEICGLTMDLDALRADLTGLPTAWRVRISRLPRSAGLVFDGDGWRLVRMRMDRHCAGGPHVPAFAVGYGSQ